MAIPKYLLTSVWIDRLLAWLKWPAAVIALLLLPGAGLALMDLLIQIAQQPVGMLMFFAGCGVYLILWWVVFRHSRLSLLLTVEHELTHALFAVLTFHPVRNLRVTMTRGGTIEVIGIGNWLIVVAPYFFPTATVLLMLVTMLMALWLPPVLTAAANVLIGASFAYHLTSTIKETTPGQPDLKKAGRVFSLLFLPTANIISIGLVLAFAQNGLWGFAQFLLNVVHRSVGLVTYWFN